MRNPYDVMGLPKTANKEEIKKRFKELAKKFHPDVNKEPDAKERFAELNESYQILSDDNKRNILDQTGSAEAASGQGDHGMGGDPFGGFHGGGARSAEDIFNQFFGMGGQFGGPFSSAFSGFGGGGEEFRSTQPERGENIRKSTTITFKESVTGTKRDFMIDKATPCESCHGSGKDPNTKPKKCPTCGGQGRIHARQGFMVFESTCSTCSGTGRLHEPCTPCHGSGYTLENKKYELVIRPGVEDGQLLRMVSLGKPGYNGGPPGDMYMEVKVIPDPIYRRKGQNLEMDAEISLPHAVLGGKICVPGLIDGEVPVEIPAGTQPGDTVVIPKQGVTTKTHTGDLVVHLKVKVPKYLTNEQRQLFEAYAKTEIDDQYKHCNTKSWWSKWPFGKAVE